jgi:hypothetical protein
LAVVRRQGQVNGEKGVDGHEAGILPPPEAAGVNVRFLVKLQRQVAAVGTLPD